MFRRPALHGYVKGWTHAGTLFLGTCVFVRARGRPLPLLEVACPKNRGLACPCSRTRSGEAEHDAPPAGGATGGAHLAYSRSK